jgi:signal transduction histidine kinase
MSNERVDGADPSFLSRAFPRLESLSGRLIVFGTLVTLVAVASSILVLSVLIRRQARTHLVELLSQNQASARDLQKRSLTELLWISTLLSESPTLRAAMDTYRSEATVTGARRADLLATIGTEVDRLRDLVGKGAAIVTDERGVILAASPQAGLKLGAGVDLSGRRWMREVLESSSPDVRPVFGVMSLGEGPFHVGCVPIVMQGFVIGTLTLGDRMDSAWLSARRSASRSDVALILDEETADATLEFGRLDPTMLARIHESKGPGPGSVELLPIGGQEYLVAPIPLGSDDQGRPATLLLVQSLTLALQPVQRSLLVALLSCGILTVVLAGIAAWRIARSILSPLERFVAFIRSMATHRDASLRFEDRGLTTEIRILNEAFGDLLGSLQTREKEELTRVERLKESEKLAALGRMLSGAAHEINNPLTGVMGQVDLALAAGKMDEAARGRLESARREAKRIAALVRNLLKVAHRDTGERKQVDLHQILRETIALRQHDYDTAGLKLAYEPSAGPLELEANELELQQVFLNIINNAYDAMKELGVGEGLTIRTQLQNGRVVVTLADSGPGMKDPGKVFDHFYTTKDVGKGTGLGLSISHAIVQNHGGAISAQNTREGGACFTITLPLGPREPAAKTGPASPVPAPPGAPPAIATALVVEDEASVLEYQLEILRSLGATPVGARSGDEAVECLKVREFQVIVSDLKMPGGMSGADLFQWVMHNRPALASRFVFVTGDTASESTREFLQRAGRPYLMKPFGVDDYVRALRESQESLVSA